MISISLQSLNVKEEKERMKIKIGVIDVNMRKNPLVIYTEIGSPKELGLKWLIFLNWTPILVGMWFGEDQQSNMIKTHV